ncbi:HAD-like protein [Dothidotthia symphoricarpi CBS 119687]|uniref:HAD-like protein n=1 Tax=Dothidotthia symphoricarpi CBS 119687 TaxID=1392245 RepID=A0A6A6A7W5_9PLEO|nr:HAD-like protein [Dothidotthia symphoricarpi CBS 119687]KAF2126907.1 HAD-like protein [Dothidotthia symphoricarpi CBS 119687]
MASSHKPPKAILFDIGGVVVISPFQAILDYETENKIPIGYINYAIQAGPHDTGAWQLIERGDVELNDDWFAAFRTQLSNPQVWGAYLRKVAAQGELGGGQVVDGGGLPPVPDINAKTLFWRMMRISRAPDPYMYPALRKLQESGKFVLGALSNTVAFPTDILDDEGVLFTKALRHAPAPNPYAQDSTDITTCFDIFISSAHVGLRKPDPAAYELAVREMDKISRAKGLGGVTAEETLFLDDIGVNLKFARLSGLRTIKVGLGRTKEAVSELEAEVGMALLGDRAKL